MATATSQQTRSPSWLETQAQRRERSPLETLRAGEGDYQNALEARTEAPGAGQRMTTETETETETQAESGSRNATLNANVIVVAFWFEVNAVHCQGGFWNGNGSTDGQETIRDGQREKTCGPMSTTRFHSQLVVWAMSSTVWVWKRVMWRRMRKRKMLRPRPRPYWSQSGARMRGPIAVGLNLDGLGRENPTAAPLRAL
jgi:hypothetical protein